MSTLPTIPFVVGQWVRGERFYGRQAQIDEILEGPRNSLWLLGTRRVGKTSLLKQLEHLAATSPERGFVPLFWDLQGAEEPEELHLDFGDALLDAEEHLERVGIAVSDLAADDLFSSLARLRRQLRSRRLRLLLLCDEVEELIHLQRAQPALLRKLRRALQSYAEVRSVLASTVRLWALADQPEDTSPFLHGLLPPLYLAGLLDDEAKELLRQAALPEDRRPDLSEATLAGICVRCSNHPYLLQLVGKRVLETGDLAEALDLVATDRTVSHFFSVDFEMLSANEREVLATLARCDVASSRSLARHLHVDEASLSGSLQQMEGLGLICRDPDRGLVIANSFFRRWLLESSAISTVKHREARPASPLPPRPSQSDETLEGLGMIDGRYRLLKQIGAGGTGLVYRAQDTVLGAEIALKVLRPELLADDAVLERVRQEIVLSRDLSHPNILHVYHLGVAEGQAFLTMQWVDGPTLAELIAEEAPFPERWVLAVGAKLAAALAAAHERGVLHRDVKPHNVLIDTSGEPLLADFGLARDLRGAGITQAGVFLGTPGYASPEQARFEPVDERSDIYSLGVVLFEMATGRRPFCGETTAAILDQHRHAAPPDPRSLEPAVSEDLARLIGRCLEKERDRRFDTAGELSAVLGGLLQARESEQRSRATKVVVERSRQKAGELSERVDAELFPLVYEELHQLARRYLSRERADHTLQPTALVNEAYLRLVDAKDVSWQGRTHFLATGALAMRRVLVEHGRARGRLKRGGNAPRVVFDDELAPPHPGELGREELLALDAALEKLRRLDERQARVVELRFFSGLTVQEVARYLGLSKRTVEAEWTRAREWLKAELS